MISTLGQLLVLAGLLFAAFGAPAAFIAGRRRDVRTLALAQRAAFGFGFSMVASNLVMIYALITDDFSVRYVAEVGSRATPLYFKIPSLWASLDGSILFWAGILGMYAILFTALHRRTHREYTPYALGTLLAVSIFFTLLVASIANPFELVDPVPADGPGPNPLLQNHWLMAFHPPMLYGGYVGMVVPFSMACAALLAGRLESGWMLPLRRWMLVPWAFLSIGIAMGGWWSYAVLGWGGYWAWDPVENASFLPWLTATAALHSSLVTHRRGTLKTWTLTLIMASFLLTLFGTFLTRSGVFNSVHSFTQSEIGPIFLGFIALMSACSLLLLATRDHTLVTDGASRMGRMHPLGRELTLFLQNLVFVAFTFVVFLGTVFPLLAEALQGRRLSVGEPYFDRMAGPLGLLLVFLMGVGPALPWGRLRSQTAGRQFLPPLIGGLLCSGLVALLGFTTPYTLLSLFVCGFAFTVSLREFLSPAWNRARARGEPFTTAAFQVFRRGRRRYGGHLAHVGIVLAVAAITLSKGYKQEMDFTLEPGQSARIGAWSATFTGARLDEHPNRDALVASFVIHRGDRELGTLEPALNYYPTQREPIGTPAVYSSPTTDFYLSLVQVEPNGAYASVRAMTMPMVLWLWISAPVLALSALVILWPSRRRAAESVTTTEVEGSPA